MLKFSRFDALPPDEQAAVEWAVAEERAERGQAGGINAVYMNQDIDRWTQEAQEAMASDPGRVAAAVRRHTAFKEGLRAKYGIGSKPSGHSVA